MRLVAVACRKSLQPRQKSPLSWGDCLAHIRGCCAPAQGCCAQVIFLFQARGSTDLFLYLQQPSLAALGLYETEACIEINQSAYARQCASLRFGDLNIFFSRLRPIFWLSLLYCLFHQSTILARLPNLLHFFLSNVSVQLCNLLSIFLEPKTIIKTRL